MSICPCCGSGEMSWNELNCRLECHACGLNGDVPTVDDKSGMARYFRETLQIHERRRGILEPLSFRDQCAIAILLICYGVEGNNMKQDIAQHAFDLADAMEAERQKRSAAK